MTGFFDWIFDWIFVTGFSAFVVIGQSNYFGFVFFDTQSKTAPLINTKTTCYLKVINNNNTSCIHEVVDRQKL